MESLIVFAAIAFTINKIVSSVKAARAGQWNTPVTQLLCLVVGIAVISLAAHSSITQSYQLPGFTQTLGDIDAGSIVLFSLLASSSGSFLYDWKKARDGSDSAAEPSLLPGSATNDVSGGQTG